MNKETMMNNQNPDLKASNPKSTQEINLELLALNLDSCTRCVGTLHNIETAIASIKNITDITGAAISVNKILIESGEDAKKHRFVSSPTIRINNRDIVFETLENECDSCNDLCGCDEGINCRVWKYREKEFTEAPVGLIVEALMAAIFGEHKNLTREANTYEKVPENLTRFFASNANKMGEKESECCPPNAQETCCEPSEKDVCCQTEEPATCGCL